MSALLDFNYANQLTGRLENFKWIRPMLGNCRCPMCGDSSKKKSKRRFYIYQNHKASGNHLSVDCKNCGYSNPFSKFLEEFDSFLYQEYRLELFKELGFTKKRVKKEVPSATKPIFEVEEAEQLERLPGCVAISELPEKHPAAEYIRGRLIPSEYHHLIWYSPNFKKSLEGFAIQDINLSDEERLKLPEDERIVIPFYNEWNKLIVVQGRSMDNSSSLRYITIKKEDGARKLYGLERLNKSRTVLVVEGPFDSLFLPNCVATADSDLLSADMKDAIYIPDNQYRNTEICNKIQGLIDKGERVVLFPKQIIWKDINDIVQKGGFTKHELYKLIAENVYQGLSATLEFAKLRKDRKKSP